MKKKILLIAETMDNKMKDTELELLSFAEILKQRFDSETVFIIPGKDTSQLAEKTAQEHGIETIALHHKDLLYPNPELLWRSLGSLIEKYDPLAICFIHTTRGAHCAAALGTSFSSQCITAVESVTASADGMSVKRSILNGKISMTELLESFPVILTIMPGAFPQPEKQVKNDTKTSTQTRISIEDEISGFQPTGIIETEKSDINLNEADVIISAGRGIGTEENLELIRETARIFPSSAIAASRPVCDNRWLSYQHQVGATGKTVSPKLYMACGISGSQQHIAGMKSSQVIVSINTDPEAAIFSISDYIIIEDLKVFLPVFINKYNEKYGNQ